MKPRRRQARWCVVLLLTMIGAVGLTGTAAAHTELIGSDPADGATLEQAPSSITLTFNEPVQDFEPLLAITGPDGQPYPAGVPVVDSATLRGDVQALGPAGTYAVAYRVVSDDGHPVTGQLQFQLTVPAIPPSTATAEPGTGAPVVPPAATAATAPAGPAAPAGASSSGPSGGAGAESAGPSSSSSVPADVTTSASVEPAVSTTSGGGSNGTPIWVWVVLGAAIIAVLIALQQRRARTRTRT